MMRVGRRAAAHDAGLAGYESGVLLIAQANGLAHDSAADGADFLGDLCKGTDAVFDVAARVWLGSDLAGFSRRLLRFLAGKRFQLHREATFDELPVGLRQQILVGHSPMNPVCASSALVRSSSSAIRRSRSAADSS
jgi:hypothetical protein